MTFLFPLSEFLTRTIIENSCTQYALTKVALCLRKYSATVKTLQLYDDIVDR